MDADKVFDKIKKLNAMAESNSPHEAAIAAAKLQKLLAEENLVLDKVIAAGDTDRGDIIIETALDWASKPAGWRDILLNGLAINNYCHAIKQQRTTGVTTVKFNIRNDKGWKYTKEYNLIIIGKEINVSAVIYLYNNLSAQLERMADTEFSKYKNSGGYLHGKAWKNQFYTAAVSVLLSELRKSRQQTAQANPAINALIISRKAELDEFLTENFTDLTPGKRHKMKNKNYDAITAGYNAGKQIKPQAAAAAGVNNSSVAYLE